MRASVLVGIVMVAGSWRVVRASRRRFPTPTNQSAHSGHTAAPGAPRTALLGNLGSYHRTIKTTNDDAQKFFDEGLTLLYGFNHEESFKSFVLAADRDAAVADAALGHVAGAGHQHQRHRAG